VDGVLNATLINELWALIQQRVEAHSMTNYRKLIVGLSQTEKADKGE
jgi:hypothetical protein